MKTNLHRAMLNKQKKIDDYDIAQVNIPTREKYSENEIDQCDVVNVVAPREFLRLTENKKEIVLLNNRVLVKQQNEENYVEFNFDVWKQFRDSVTGKPIPRDGNVVIPSVLTDKDGNEYKLVGIGVHAFQNCKNITHVEIPDNIKVIDNGAFKGCENLISVRLPEEITKIGMNTFSGCEKLNNVNIPNSVTTISSGAFLNCKSITRIEIPSSVAEISRYAFEGCAEDMLVSYKDQEIRYGDICGRSQNNSLNLKDTLDEIIEQQSLFSEPTSEELEEFKSEPQKPVEEYEMVGGTRADDIEDPTPDMEPSDQRGDIGQSYDDNDDILLDYFPEV